MAPERDRLTAAIVDICDILQTLSGPRDCARVLSGAQIMVIKSTGATSEDQVKAMLDESRDTTLQVWRETAEHTRN